MKPRTQILDKTQKKEWKWTSGMGLHKIHTSLCFSGHEWGEQVELSNHISNKRDGLFY
jgi:hypothetical protein